MRACRQQAGDQEHDGRCLRGGRPYGVRCHARSTCGYGGRFHECVLQRAACAVWYKV
jgi:hypothetical protein